VLLSRLILETLIAYSQSADKDPSGGQSNAAPKMQDNRAIVVGRLGCIYQRVCSDIGFFLDLALH